MLVNARLYWNAIENLAIFTVSKLGGFTDLQKYLCNLDCEVASGIIAI